MKYLEQLEISNKNIGFITQIRSEVDDFFINFSDSQDKTSRWAHHYFCEADGGRFIFNNKSPHSHICSVCGKESKSDLFDGCWITMYRNEGVTNAWKSAYLYKSTGEKKYLDNVLNFTNFYNDNYLKFTLHNKEGFDFENLETALWGTSRIMPQSLNEAIFIIRLINALEIIREDLPKGLLKKLEDGMFKESFKMFIPQVNEIHNIRIWLNCAIGVMGHFVNNTDMIDFAYNGEYSIGEQLTKGVTNDYFWYEGSVHYNYFLLEGVVNLLLFSSLYDYDFKVGREVVEKMLSAGYEYAFDTHLLPNPNDGWPDVNLKTYSYIYAVATKVYGINSKIGQILGSIVNKEGERGQLPLSKPYYYQNDMSFEELIFTPTVRETNKEILMCKSVNFKSSFFGIIKKDQTNIFLKYGHNGPSHAHPDKMNIEVMLSGVMISRDLSNSGYGNPLCNEWQRKSPSHNTVAINGKSHTGFEGGKTLVESSTRLKAISENVYDGVNFIRDIEITENGFSDEFQVELSEESTCDFFFHVEGELKTSLDLKPADLKFKGEGYQHFQDPKKVMNVNDVIEIDWLISNKNFRSKIGLKDCELFIATSPDNSKKGTRKTIILRQRTKLAKFNINWEII